jgi:hypothetical protein
MVGSKLPQVEGGVNEAALTIAHAGRSNLFAAKGI